MNQLAKKFTKEIATFNMETKQLHISNVVTSPILKYWCEGEYQYSLSKSGNLYITMIAYEMNKSNKNIKVEKLALAKKFNEKYTIFNITKKQLHVSNVTTSQITKYWYDGDCQYSLSSSGNLYITAVPTFVK
jgi:hypothetical protein